MIKADNSQIMFGYIDDIEGWSVPLVIDIEEAVRLIEEYDPDDKYSPSAADSREIARVFLDALKAAIEG